MEGCRFYKIGKPCALGEIQKKGVSSSDAIQDDFESCWIGFSSGHFVKNCDKRAYQVWFSDILYFGQTDSSFLLQFSQFENDCSLVYT